MRTTTPTTTTTTTSMKSSQASGLDDEMRATTWMTTLHSSHPALKTKVSTAYNRHIIPS